MRIFKWVKERITKCVVEVLVVVRATTLAVEQVSLAVAVAVRATTMVMAGASRESVFSFVRGQAGAISLNRLISMLILAFVAIQFVFQMTPSIESGTNTDNITNPFTKSMGGMVGWLLPVGAIVVIILGVVDMFKGGGRGRGGGR